ncbi:HMG domain-containing protein 3-like [Dendronephthya gigantea]|uniref:HMG domain-containing protein 3-like n=1 Tax=Dendronephthya gigantea TaxID=151771 RepID=UPI00106B2F40|nr:HMG domain-containing protein 3-like [Dendronephthya gigantea]
MNTIEQCSVEKLKELCHLCNIAISGKSKARMLIDLRSLYETLLVGSCPCHGFTKVPGHTGGFYHIVCRHGVTAASKFLTLQESVRHAADLYLSFKHIPLVFLCDTACGFVRHLECRVSKEMTEQLWKDNRRCFEVPSLDKPPSKEMSVPMLTTAEYRKSDNDMIQVEDGSMIHPLTGTSRRYVLGDRFHTASNPHKSPLCEYHNINLLSQSNTIKTSYQESENNRKNVRRLRSSTMQNFSTHYFYNFLMDFYQNEEIVKKQHDVASRQLKPGQMLCRNSYMQFVIKDGEK